MEENYRTLHDFVLDPGFCDWVLNRDDHTASYWQSYINSNPGKRILIEQARTLVLSLSTGADQQWNSNEKAEVWSQIQERISAPTESDLVNTEGGNGFRRLRGWKYGLRIAASITAIIMLSAALYQLFSQGQEDTFKYATSYGEVKRVLLPDGSEVTLNGNSSLSYKKPKDSDYPREVTLNGEAFFKVTHQQNDQKFKVRLAENVFIEVIGTEFTATQRPHDTRVILNEGKVNFAVTDEGFLGYFKETLAKETLKPGELTAYSSGTTGKPKLVKRTVQNPEIYNAFQHNKLMFADAPLTEVACVLEDVYGYKVTFTNKEVRSRRYTGSVPHDKVEVLLITLEKLFNLKISQKGNQLEIS